MVDDAQAFKGFGCPQCCPASPDSAWKARGALAREAELIDESHFHVMILVCRGCAQRFVSVFTELIDWKESDDSQDWTLLPITGTEAAELIQRSSSLTETQLNELGPKRRSLRHFHPTGGAPRSFWDTGLSLGMHD